MKKVKRIVSVFLIVAALLSTQLTMSVSAATSTKAYNCDKTITMTVKTGNGKDKPSMRLACNAATEKETWGYGFTKKTYTHKCAVAPKMRIKVSPAVNGQNVWYISGCGRSIASTLKLDKNKTYTITVSYVKEACNRKCAISTSQMGIFHDGEYVGNGNMAYCNGTWYVKSSKNLNISKISVR